jgi:hypothetical protein
MSSRTRLWAAISAVLLMLGVAGYAQATTHHSSKRASIIHSCVGPTGKVRIGVSCTAGQRALSWNKRGPQGPAGPTGPPGTVPPLNIHQSVGVTATIQDGTQQQIQSTCASGQAVGGGWTDGLANAHVYPTESKALDANTWQFTFVNYEGSAQQVTAYTICVG